jgi:hypothetical protein
MGKCTISPYNEMPHFPRRKSVITASHVSRKFFFTLRP